MVNNNNNFIDDTIVEENEEGERKEAIPVFKNAKDFQFSDLQQLFRELNTPNCKIHALNLSFSNIEPENVKQLAQILSLPSCKLTSLSLVFASPAITEEGGGLEIIRALKSNRTMRDLNLSYNNLGTKAAIKLGFEIANSNCYLKSLNLSGNKAILSAGAIGLALGLRFNTSLKSLSLRDCGLNDEAGRMMLYVLRHCNETLETISIMQNSINDKLAAEIELQRRLNISMNLIKNIINDCRPTENNDAGSFTFDGMQNHYEQPVSFTSIAKKRDPSLLNTISKFPICCKINAKPTLILWKISFVQLIVNEMFIPQ